MYGNAEEVTGNLAAKLGLLDDLWVGTKVWTEGRDEWIAQMEQSMSELDFVQEWAAEFDCTAWSQFFLKYIVSHPAVTCAIPATSNPRHMRENMGACRGRLPDEPTRRRMEQLIDSVRRAGRNSPGSGDFTALGAEGGVRSREAPCLHHRPRRGGIGEVAHRVMGVTGSGALRGPVLDGHGISRR